MRIFRGKSSASWAPVAGFSDQHDAVSRHSGSCRPSARRPLAPVSGPARQRRVSDRPGIQGGRGGGKLPPISDQIHGCCSSRGASKQASFRTSSSVPGHRSSTLATGFRALRVCPASGSLCLPRCPAHPIEKETTIIKHHPDLVPEITTYDPEHPRNDVNTAVEIAPEHGMTQRRQDGPQPGIVRRRPGLTAVQNLPVCPQAGLMLKQRRQCGAFDRSLRALP